MKNTFEITKKYTQFDAPFADVAQRCKKYCCSFVGPARITRNRKTPTFYGTYGFVFDLMFNSILDAKKSASLAQKFFRLLGQFFQH